MEDMDKMIQQSIKKAFQGTPISDPKEKNSAIKQTMQSMKETKKVEENPEVNFFDGYSAPKLEMFLDTKQEAEKEKPKKEENKEATSSGSAGGFSQPLFGKPVKRKISKPEGGFVSEEKLKGGVSDKKTLEDVAKKHTVELEKLKQELDKGVKVEMEHTNDKDKAKEIAMDHLFEDPNYYVKLNKIEATEATSSSSSGSYESPFFLAKNKKNWRGGAKPQIPGGKFVEIKKKCKTFPYCNQGDIDALNIFEKEYIKEAIDRVHKQTGVEKYVIKNLILQELSKN
jgi:hypothetical protein